MVFINASLFQKAIFHLGSHHSFTLVFLSLLLNTVKTHSQAFSFLPLHITSTFLETPLLNHIAALIFPPLAPFPFCLSNRAAPFL